MKKEEFRTWLIKKGANNNKVISDTLSRVKRVEIAFTEIIPSFSYAKEFKKDKGVSLCESLSSKGKNLPDDIHLPKGSKQMFSIASAVKKYMHFLSDAIGN